MCKSSTFGLFLLPKMERVNSIQALTNMNPNMTGNGYKFVPVAKYSSLSNTVQIFEFTFDAYVISYQSLWDYSCSAYLKILEGSRFLPNSSIHATKLNCVLDLDKTLIVSVRLDTATEAQRLASSATFVASNIEMCLILRPGLRDFLTKLSSLYDYAICTMGTSEYLLKVVEVLRKLFPELTWSPSSISSDYTRISTDTMNGIKDLRFFFCIPTCLLLE